jgi:hypothetical protein
MPWICAVQSEYVLPSFVTGYVVFLREKRQHHPFTDYNIVQALLTQVERGDKSPPPTKSEVTEE